MKLINYLIDNVDCKDFSENLKDLDVKKELYVSAFKVFSISYLRDVSPVKVFIGFKDLEDDSTKRKIHLLSEFLKNVDLDNLNESSDEILTYWLKGIFVFYVQEDPDNVLDYSDLWRFFSEDPLDTLEIFETLEEAEAYYTEAKKQAILNLDSLKENLIKECVNETEVEEIEETVEFTKYMYELDK